MLVSTKRIKALAYHFSCCQNVNVIADLKKTITKERKRNIRMKELSVRIILPEKMKAVIHVVFL
jgi:hypothetical protein